MRHFLLATILVLALLMPTWGAVAEQAILEDVKMYAEKVISMPDGYASMVSMAIAPDGSVVVAAKKNEGGWALLTWHDLSEEPSALPLSFEEGDISSIDIAPDGQVMAQISGLSSIAQALTGGGQNQAQGGQSQQPAGGQPSGQGGGGQGGQGGRGQNGGQGGGGQTFQFGANNMRTTVIWFAADGSVDARFEVPAILTTAKALSGKRLAAYGYQSGLTIYDASGAEVTQLQTQDAVNFAATESSLFVVGSEKIVEFDLASGQELRSIPVKSNYSTSMALTSNGALYLLDGEGGYQVSMEDGQKTHIMELTGTLMGDPSYSLTNFGVQADGSMVVFLSSSGGFGDIGNAAARMGIRIGSSESGVLAIYAPLDPAIVGERTPFSITALRNSGRLRKAVSDFQRLHPELKVSLQIQMEQGSEAPVEDHIRTLNTDLLAGKGGDIIVLDGLPMDKYASKGILMDLTDLVPELNLLQGIVNGSTAKDGKIYLLPAQFSFGVLWGRKNLVGNIQMLDDLPYADYAQDQVPFTSRTPENWLRLLYPASEASFRDGDNRLQFDTPEFQAFLETVYELYSQQDEMSNLNTQGGGNRGRMGGFNVQEMLSIYNGAVAFLPMDVGSLMQLSTAYSVSGGRESGFITLPAMDGSGRAYTPGLSVGINAKTKSPDMAKEFMRVLFSANVQESDQMNGLPVAKASLDKLFADAVERSQTGTQMFMIPGGVTMEIVQPDEAAWDALRQLCDEVDTPATIDETLMGFMIAETENFFEGRTSAADAAYALQQRAWFYLNE